MKLQFLGWNSFQMRWGESVSGKERWTTIELDWQPAGIRNCSYSSEADLIGITAEDRTQRRQVLAIYDCRAKSTRVLLCFDYVLHHSLNQKGTKVCYTIPSATPSHADLYLCALKEPKPQLVAKAAVAQDSIPVWFQSDKRIAYHSPNGQIELLDMSSGKRETIIDGMSPAVSPDGGRIVFCRNDQLFIWTETSRQVQRPKILPDFKSGRLANSLSWSPDGAYVSFGVVAGLTDKGVKFYVVELATEKSRRIKSDHLRSVLIVARSTT